MILLSEIVSAFPAVGAVWRSSTRRLLAGIGSGLSLLLPPGVTAAPVEIPAPAGSHWFGQNITVLPNGNFVVTDPYYDAPGPVEAVGAVWLYDGATLQPISMMTGSRAWDSVGFGGVTVLKNGHYVVCSPIWDFNGSVQDAGAVTWCSATAGVNGKVSAENSLVGNVQQSRVGWSSDTGDQREGAVALANGNYVVVSQYWGDSLGAVTWCDGGGGRTGVVSTGNSLTGSQASDQVGSNGVIPLRNGNYVVRSGEWRNARGAVTFGSGTAGLKGVVSEVNSLLGTASFESIGYGRVTELANGNYIVIMPSWGGGRGAVAWGSGAGGVTGLVSAANSLTGTTAGDRVGGAEYSNGHAPMTLPNGGYVIISPDWSGRRGAVTWGSPSGGVRGSVSAANSLVGTAPADTAGSGGVSVLSNGNYVVRSPAWAADAEKPQAGAVTWGSGAAGIAGPVSSSNSLTGSSRWDFVGSSGVTALTNGNYIVCSPEWNDRNGAATWGDGGQGVKGPVSVENSLIGSEFHDMVGFGGAAALSDGNYVVSSPNWGFRKGAVTWASGATGLAGAVSASNSLVGEETNLNVGIGGGGRSVSTLGLIMEGCPGIKVLLNGAYVILSPEWGQSRGAVTWSAGGAPLTGVVSEANSLTGGQSGDKVGSAGVEMIQLGGVPEALNYLVLSPRWGKNRGAATWGSGLTGVKGPVSAANSLVGASESSPEREGDYVGSSQAVLLPNGNYLVRSPAWDGQRGAVTWGSGGTGISGMISPANSVTGGGMDLHAGLGGVRAFNDGNYLIISSQNSFDGGLTTGRMTPGDGAAGTRGELSDRNSTPAAGSDPQKGPLMTPAYDPVHSQLIAGYYPEGKILVMKLAPDISLAGAGVPITNGSPQPDPANQTDFGGAPPQGAGSIRTFTVSNNGVLAVHLTGSPAVALSGENAADFTVVAQPGPMVGGASSVTFQIMFRPAATGLRKAEVRISHDAGSGGTHTFTVQGTGRTVLESWRKLSFGDAVQRTGMAEDFDLDGLPNFQEFAFGTDGGQGLDGPGGLRYSGSIVAGGGVLDAPGQPVVVSESGSLRALFVRRRSSGESGLTYLPQFSADLKTWVDSLENPQVLAAGGDLEVVSLPPPSGQSAGFFRVRVGYGP